MFIIQILKLEQIKWGYGRKPKSKKIFNIEIKLPFKDKKIDYKYMENFIKSLNYSKYI